MVSPPPLLPITSFMCGIAVDDSNCFLLNLWSTLEFAKHSCCSKLKKNEIVIVELCKAIKDKAQY